MKIICLSDTHGAHGYIKIPQGDVLVHAGDFTGMGREEEIKSFAAWLKTLPHEHKIVIAGNHDVTFQRSPEKAREWLGDSCTYLENEGIEIDGVKFWGSPYHPWFADVWAFGLKTLEERKKNWDIVPDDTNVLITHGPPFGILDANETGSKLGDPELLDALKRVNPRFNVFGHIHEGGGGAKIVTNTVFLNLAVLNEKYELVRGAAAIEI